MGRSLTVLVGLALMTAAGGVFLLSQTVVGRQAVAAFVEDALRGAVRGEVTLGPVLGGNLVTRAHLARLEMSTLDGVPFLALEGVRVEYSPISFLADDFRFRRVEARRVRLLLRQEPEGGWNFQRLFPDDGEGGTTRILLQDVQIEAGELTVRIPWRPEGEGAAARAEVEAALRGEKVWRIVPAGPGAYERRLELDSLRGRFPLMRLADPTRPMRIELEGVAATARVVAQPLEIRRFDGNVVFRDSIQLEVGALRTAESSLAGRGWVVPEDPPHFRFDLRADPVAFAELAWLPIPVPRSGGGSMDLALRTEGETVVVEAGEGEMRVEESRLAGSFAVALEETPLFRSLELELSPLRIALVDELLGREPVVDGTMRGRLSGSGPLDLLRVDADLELRGLQQERTVSRLRARGRVSVGEPYEMRGLELEMAELEPRWAGLVGVQLEVGGRVTGRATLDGRTRGALSFTADLRHQLPGDSLSHLVGEGTLDRDGAPRVDLRFAAQPLSLSLVDPYARGIDLTGVVRGPFTASGTLDDLRVTADLRTPRGLLNFDGRFDLSAEATEYDARLVATDLQLRQWAAGGPETRLAVRGRVRGKGTDPATLTGTFDLEILPSIFEGARVDSSLLRFRLAEGLATADTFAIRTDVGSVDGFGSFGLVEGRSGSLILDVTAPDLASWNRWLVPGRHPTRPDTSLAALFGQFEEEGENGPLPDTAPDSLSGGLTGRGVLFGSVRDFSFGGRVTAAEVEYGGLGADSLRFTLDVANPRALDSLVVRAFGWGVSGAGTTADSLFLRLQRRGPVWSDVQAYVRRDTTLEAEGEASVGLAEARRTLELRTFRWRVGEREYRLRGPARLVHGEEGLVVEGLELVGSGGERLRVEGAVPEAGMADLDVRIESLSLGDAARPWREPGRLEGVLDAALRVRGTAGSPRAEGSFRLREPTWDSLSIPLLEGELRYADRRLEGRAELRGSERRLAELEGSLAVDLSLHDVDERLLPSPLDVTVRADSLPLAPLEHAFRTLRVVEGTARGEVRARGEPGSLRYQGRIRIAEGAATLPNLGVRFTRLGGRVRFEESRALIDSVTFASSAGGTASIAGEVELSSFTDPGFDLELSASSLGAISNRLARASIDGRGHLGGEYRRAELTGSFRLANGEIQVDRFLRQRQAVDLSDPEIRALIDTTVVVEREVLRGLGDPFMDNIRLDVALRFGPDLWLRSSILEMELVGEVQLQMDRRTDALSAVGDLRIPRGTYTYTRAELGGIYSRELQVTGGTISFVGTPGLDPNLDIQAEYRTRTQELGLLVVRARIGGTMLQPTLTTSSEPPLPESDRICYLLFASPCVGVGERPEFAYSLIREGFLGTLGSGFSDALVGETGVVDYLTLRSAGTLPGTTTENGLLLGDTEVEVGRYLGRNLFVRASQPLGERLPGLYLEWQFAEGWTLEARTEERYRPLSLTTSASNIDTDRTYGLFLFREWSF